jgi:hypothetical protein
MYVGARKEWLGDRDAAASGEFGRPWRTKLQESKLSANISSLAP